MATVHPSFLSRPADDGRPSCNAVPMTPQQQRGTLLTLSDADRTALLARQKAGQYDARRRQMALERAFGPSAAMPSRHER